MASSGSPSSKHYEPVQQQKHENETHNDDSSDDDDDDLMRIPMDTSQDSDDDKTEPMSNRHAHLSFDLEDDEEELVERYRFSQQTSDNNNTSSKENVTWWQAYLETRTEHERKRAEQLLVMNEDSVRERIMFCLSSWTDVYDTRGVLLHVVAVLVWLVLCRVSRKPILVLLGIMCIVARILWRPFYWYTCGRRQEQKRQEAMQMYDNLNGTPSSWNGTEEEDIMHDNVV